MNTRSSLQLLAAIVMAIAFTSSAAVATEEAGQNADATGGALAIPALTFSGQGGGEVSRTEPRRAGADQQFVHFWYTPGHWLEWTVEVAEAGQYDLALRYAGKHNALRSLEINGRAVEKLESVSIPNSGSWKRWTDDTLPAKVPLVAGRNVIRMTCLDNVSLRLSQIKLSAENRIPLIIDATLISGQGGGRAQIISPPAAGYVSRWSAAGQYLEWTVPVAAAGRYSVGLHYSADGYSRLQLQVNGQQAEGLEDFILPYTGDERQYTRGTLPVTIALAAGQNTIRLTTLGGERRGMPAFSGPFSLSLLLLTPLADGQTPGKDLLTLTAPADLVRPQQPAPVVDPAPLGPPLPELQGAVALQEGQAIELKGRRAVIVTADVVPYVENRFSKRYEFENFNNPDLHRLRATYNLDQVVAAGRDEFEKQMLLMKWAWDQWDFGHAQERYNLRCTFEILEQARREHKFQCMHSAAVLQSAANSMGWVMRQMAIPQHTFNEIWSNQLGKWIMVDATSNYYPEKHGRPLNTYEFRHALLREGGADIIRGAMGNDGQIQRREQSSNYGRRLLFIGYLTNTDSLVRGPLYGGDKFFITKDELSAERSWHNRDCPDDPATEPYFPINQAAMAIVPMGADLQVTLGTMTPNFEQFQIRHNGGQWQASPEVFNWTLKAGANRLEARSVNRFGVPGPVSTLVLNVNQ